MSECKLCYKKHAVSYTSFPACQHIFGTKCLSEFYQAKFEEDNYYIPKCPLEECSMILEVDKIEEIVGAELYKKYYSKCRLCDLITFQKVLIKMENCHHKFCYKCLDNMLEKDEDKCPLEKCDEKLGKGIKKKCQDIKENCLECGQTFENEEEIVKLKCCKARFCKKCIMILINNQIKFFSKERKNKVLCMICRGYLRNYLVEEIIGKSSYRIYMKKFQRKLKCKICQKYRTFEKFDELKCNHKICSKCLNEYIDAEFQNKNSKNMICPYSKCEEKIPRKLVKKYINETNNKSVEVASGQKDEYQEEVKKQGSAKIKKSKKKEENQEEIQKEVSENEERKVSKNENQEKVDAKYEDIQPKISESKSKNQPLSQNCKSCQKETDTYVSYACNHYLCEECFKFKHAEIEEGVIICDCEKKGQAYIHSINKISMHDYILKRLNNLYKSTEKINDDNDKLNQSANSAKNPEKKVQCYKNNHSVKVNITLKCKKCHLRFCFTCLSEEIQNRYNKKKDLNVILKCPNDNCSSIIEFYTLKHNIPQQLFLSLQEELLNPKPKQLIHTESLQAQLQPYEKKLSQSLDTKLDSEILCEVCFETKKLKDCLNLECNHIFCKNCLQKDWTLKINNGQIDKSFIKCLKTGCGQEIKYDFLKNFLDKKTFEKYDQFLLEFTLMNVKQKGEYTVICPNVKCGKTSYIWEGASYFECSNCHEKYCTNENCKGNWKQHEGNTCVQFKKLLNNQNLNNQNLNKQSDQKYLEDQFKKCPKCGIYIEKIKNCNYVRCESIKCQKKTIFCYLCGEYLTEKTMTFHFQNGNPYSKCKTVMDTANVQNSVEPAFYDNNLANYNRESVAGTTSMNIACTFCKTTHTPYSIFSDNQLNLNGSIYFCQSKQLYICSICKMTMKNKNIDDHVQHERSKKEKEILEKEKDKKKNPEYKCFNPKCKNKVFAKSEYVYSIESTKCSICSFVQCNFCRKINNDIESGRKHFNESHKQN